MEKVRNEVTRVKFGVVILYGGFETKQARDKAIKILALGIELQTYSGSSTTGYSHACANCTRVVKKEIGTSFAILEATVDLHFSDGKEDKVLIKIMWQKFKGISPVKDGKGYVKVSKVEVLGQRKVVEYI